MEFSKEDFSILKWLIKDEFNHEFHPLMIEIKNKLNIKVSKIALFFILLVYQYAFIFLLLLLLYNIRNSGMFNILFVLAIIFNLILPSTIARTSVARIEENPIFECLLMSNISSNRSKTIIIVSELVNFWIHNFSIEFLTIWLFWVKFRLIGIIYGLLWIVVVSFVFLGILAKKSDINRFNINSIIIYVFDMVLGGFIAFNIFKIFIGTLNKISLEEFFKPHGLSAYTKKYIYNIVSVFKSNINYFIFYLLIFVIVFILLKVISNKIYNSKAENIKDFLINKYVNILLKFTTNFFVRRDLKRIFNIIYKLNINIFTIIFPFGIVFLSIAYLFYIFNNEQTYSILIALDFIFWTAIYQFANLLVQKIPIFNISSELRNIELIVMSDKSIKQLVQSKHILLAIFCSPIMVFFVIEKLTLLFMGGHLLIILLSILIDIAIFAICIMLTLKWTLILPKFSWENIFMIKQDNFDSQILQQFLLVPSRIVTIYFAISFMLVNVVAIRFNISFISLYYILSFMGISIIFLLVKRRKKNELNIED